MSKRVKEIGSARDLSVADLIYRFHKEGEPWQKAELIKELMNKRLTQEEIGKKLALPQYEISRLSRLLNLTPKLFQALRQGEIAKSTGYELSKLGKETQRGFEPRLGERLTFAEVENYRKREDLEEVLDVLEESPSVEDLEGASHANSHKMVTCPKCGHKFSIK